MHFSCICSVLDSLEFFEARKDFLDRLHIPIIFAYELIRNFMIEYAPALRKWDARKIRFLPVLYAVQDKNQLTCDGKKFFFASHPSSSTTNKQFVVLISWEEKNREKKLDLKECKMYYYSRSC